VIFFPLNVGVKQLDNLSPSLFKIFVNDLPSYLPNTSDPVNVNVNTSKIKILIFNKAGRLIKHSFYNIIKQGTYSYVKQFNFDPSMYCRIKSLF
jgi:hypothetical protein